MTCLKIWFAATLAAVLATSARADDQEALRKSVRAHVGGLAPTRVKALLERALALLGTPYVWGADDARADGGFDCAGLAYHLYHASGLEFPHARFSSLNMTEEPRGDVIQNVWWTAFATDFPKAMTSCLGKETADGDVLVYHAKQGGKIIDRTGHVVLAVDAEKGHAVSAAHAGVRLHALGKGFPRYGQRELTACWRAASAALPPLARPELTWSFPGQTRAGTLKDPFVMAPPLDLTATVQNAPEAARFEVLGRVLAFIGFVSPQVETIASARGSRTIRLRHDFKAEDLPVDPGETLATPLRRLVLRLLDKDGLVLGEHVVYVRFQPYWH